MLIIGAARAQRWWEGMRHIKKKKTGEENLGGQKKQLQSNTFMDDEGKEKSYNIYLPQ